MKFKYFCLIVMISSGIYSCNNDAKQHDRNIVLNDTITTPSGLKYIVLKEGEGRKIEDGSKVKAFTELYINDDENVFWSTATSKDSVFEFIHGKSKLIDGFAELNNYLVEGDSVIAIIPDSLAYKDQVKNGIPPGSTLIYKPYQVRFVSQPKAVLKDTLLHIIKTKNASEAITFYNGIVTGNKKDIFHTDIQDMLNVVSEAFQDSLYSESVVLAKHFIDQTDDKEIIQNLSYISLLSLEAENRYEEALELVTPLAKQAKNQEFWHDKMTELKTKVVLPEAN